MSKINIPGGHGVGGSRSKAFFDPTESSKNPYITIRHVPSKKVVAFKSFITNFSDSYTTEYDSEQVLGRMDPIMNYKATSRKITLDFEVVAASMEEAKRNLEKMSMLANMMYPKFTVASKTALSNISSAPLLRIHYRNLMSKAGEPNTGLLVAAEGFNYNPDFEKMAYYDDSKIYPKYAAVSMQLTVLHEHPLGWDNTTGELNEPSYPYQIKSKPAETQQANAGGDTDPDSANASNHLEATEETMLG